MSTQPLTHKIDHSILRHMNNEDQANTTELDLKRLEARVDELIQTVKTLRMRIVTYEVNKKS